MPIYEYRCPNGHTFEVFQRMTDPPAEACETCGASPVEKVLYPVAVHFKGSGFYSTDYGKGARKSTKDGSGDTSSSDGKDSSSKKESTDATKSSSSSDSSSSSPSGGSSSGSTSSD
jgi:putative FmdB family regulatory protein